MSVPAAAVAVPEDINFDKLFKELDASGFKFVEKEKIFNLATGKNNLAMITAIQEYRNPVTKDKGVVSIRALLPAVAPPPPPPLDFIPTWDYTNDGGKSFIVLPNDISSQFNGSLFSIRLLFP